MRACGAKPDRLRPLAHAPGGRYMQEYRDVRARVGFLELCKTPSLAAEVT